MAVNCYGAMLTSLSAIDAFRKVTPTLRLRMFGIGVVALTVFAVALAIPASYLASFNTFVLLMLYFRCPDGGESDGLYVVRGGHYAIGEIFNPAGIYGRWGAPA